ncbi:alpha-glucosidase domain-containing protein [Pedobacter agri]|uniref:alpha-glucosidase domain-containing protein n=1 Tax=Pedobacter agri TaxID=454586 RepID=UPI000308924A|nr:alpha-glucosidase domain-containing protein [Pedobacter agri]
MKLKFFKAIVIAAILFFVFQLNETAASVTLQTLMKDHLASEVLTVKQINGTTIELQLSNKQRLTIDFYGENIFRVFQDEDGGFIRSPEAKPAAEILVENPRKRIAKLSLQDENGTINIKTSKIEVQIDKKSSLIKILNLENKAVVLEQSSPIILDKNSASIALKEDTGEFFYGGGAQNGRFSHKGKAISIENQNSWTDGGVASPTPFYWSTKGYGIMWYTFSKGRYDFGLKEKGVVHLAHETSYLDLFIMVDAGAKELLNDYYQLTGNPVLIPKFGFYEGHLNAYNRDFWKEDEKGILFEDGKRYKESQKANGGIRESLNGEKK